MNPIDDRPCQDPKLTNISPRAIARWIQAVIRATLDLPALEMSVVEQRSRGGKLFSEAPLLVKRVAEALARKAALFADIPIAPEDLRTRQERALQFRQLRDELLKLARYANNCYVLEQFEAVTDAMAVIQQVRLDDQRPFPLPDADERADAMAPAEELLTQKMLRRQTKKKRGADATTADAATQEEAATQEGATAQPARAVKPTRTAQPARTTQPTRTAQQARTTRNAQAAGRSSAKTRRTSPRSKAVRRYQTEQAQQIALTLLPCDPADGIEDAPSAAPGPSDLSDLASSSRPGAEGRKPPAR